MLFLRLFLRSGPWFKLNNIDYSECPDTLSTMDLICEAGLGTQLQSADKQDRAGVVKAMTIVEIQSLLATLDLQPKRSGAKPPSKAQLVQLLAAALESPSEVLVNTLPPEEEKLSKLHKSICTECKQEGLAIVLLHLHCRFDRKPSVLIGYLQLGSLEDTAPSQDEADSAPLPGGKDPKGNRVPAGSVCTFGQAGLQDGAATAAPLLPERGPRPVPFPHPRPGLPEVPQLQGGPD